MQMLLIMVIILVLISLISVGVTFEYCAEGISLWINFFLFRVKILPSSVKDGKKKERSEKKSNDAAGKSKDKKKGASIKTLLSYLPVAGDALNIFRLKLCIKELTVYFRSAGDDPCSAAITFGYASAAMGVLTAFLEENFTIKKRDFRATVDFEAKEQTVYVYAKLGIRIWQVVYIALRGGFKFIKVYSNNRKAMENNGKA